MNIEIDIETINKAVSCNFSKKCLEGMDTSLCCDILARKDLFLLVQPVSSFKSSNCAYKRIVKDDDNEVYLCSCPVRIEIFDKTGK